MRLMRVVRIGGFFVFFAALAATIIFAEGYQLDVKKRDLVQKGVVVFTDAPRDITFLVDGVKTSAGAQGDLRMDPGVHTITVKKEGYLNWNKRVDVPVDTFIGFTNLTLVPTIVQESLLDASEGWQVARVANDTLVRFSNKLHAVELLQARRGFKLKTIEVPVEMQTVVPFDSMLAGITSRGLLFLFDPKTGVLTLTNTHILDIASIDSEAFVVAADGSIQRLADTKPTLQPFMSLQEPIEKITDIQKENGRYLMELKTKKESLAVVFGADGSIQHEVSGVAAVLSKEELTYVQEGKSITFDFTTKTTSVRGPLDALWMRRINDSSQVLVIDTKKRMSVCDDDGQNCILIGHVEESFAVPGNTGSLFMVRRREAYRLLDFGEKSFVPDVLSDLVSSL